MEQFVEYSPATELLRADRHQAYEYLPTGDIHWKYAFDAQCALARTGRHRAVSPTYSPPSSPANTASPSSTTRVTSIPAADVVDFSHPWVAPRGTV
jgi:hypothetical protein